MLELGLLLIVASLAMGVLGLVRRGYELLVVIAMGTLLVGGLVAIVKGLLG